MELCWEQITHDLLVYQAALALATYSLEHICHVVKAVTATNIRAIPVYLAELRLVPDTSGPCTSNPICSLQPWILQLKFLTPTDPLQGLENTVLFCGYGINDLSALSAADVGYAVGATEASVAAPVYTTHRSVAGMFC